MFFGPQRREENLSLSLEGVLIDGVSELRFLSVITDDELTRKAHVAQVKSKVCKNIFVLNKPKCVLNYKVMRHLYRLLILSYLTCSLG